MPKSLVGKVDNMQEEMGNISKKVETQWKKKGNARIEKHCNRNEECL